MVAVPGATLVTKPVDDPTVAIEEVLVVQTPHGVGSDNAVVLPMQTLLVPVIPATASFTTVDVLFHRSPGSAEKLPFTELITP